MIPLPPLFMQANAFLILLPELIILLPELLGHCLKFCTSRPSEWTIDQIIAALSRPLPKTVLDSKKRGGKTIAYLPWYEANKILDKYAPGWNWEVRSIHLSDDRLFLIGRLSIPTLEGIVYREATGTELLKEEATNKDTGEVFIRELAYGDPSSNAESMAFRRAAARFGLGLYLYDKD